MSSSSHFHPPPTIPPRTSSNRMSDVSPRDKTALMTMFEKDERSDRDKLQTNTDMSRRHTRNQSSLDGTKYKDGKWSQENEEVIMGPYDYMLQHPGKDLRRQMINAFNAWLKVPSESLAIITKVVAMLHTASLL